MVDQTHRVRPFARGSQQEGIVKDTKDVLHDAVSLSELQLKLLALDARECGRKVTASVIVLVAAACLALGAFPIGLAALALAFYAAGLSLPLSFLCSFLIGLIVAGVSGAIGWMMLKRGAKTINRSKTEFFKNIAWLKRTLAN
jgi:hypothetical protein